MLTFRGVLYLDRKGKMDMNGKGLSQIPSPVKIFIVSYMVLMMAGLLLSLWVVQKSSIWSGGGSVIPMEGRSEEDIAFEKSAMFSQNLRKAHVHHLGHLFMMFSVAGIYAFTRGRDDIKTQIIVWTAIVTLIHTLAFLIYSRILLIIFGGVYGALMTYMMIIAVADCYRSVRE